MLGEGSVHLGAGSTAGQSPRLRIIPSDCTIVTARSNSVVTKHSYEVIFQCLFCASRKKPQSLQQGIWGHAHRIKPCLSVHFSFSFLPTHSKPLTEMKAAWNRFDLAATEQRAKGVPKTAPEVKLESKSNKKCLSTRMSREKPNLESGVTQAENIIGRRETWWSSKVPEILWSQGHLYMGYLRFGDHNISKQLIGIFWVSNKLRYVDCLWTRKLFMESN